MERHEWKVLGRFFGVWFWVWAIPAAILVSIMLILGNTPDTRRTLYGMAAAIMAGFTLLPARNAFYVILLWGLNMVATRDPGFEKDLNSWALIMWRGKKEKEHNPGFDFSLFVMTSLTFLAIAFLWVADQKTSFEAVYAAIHTIAYIISFKHPVACFVDLIILALFVYAVIWFLGEVLRNRNFYKDEVGRIDWQHSWWKVVLIIVAFFIRLLTHGALIGYTAHMIGVSVRFWCIIIFVPLAIFEIRKLIRILRDRFGSSP